MQEIWKDIPEYEGLYQASNMGNIRTVEGKITSNARYPVRKWKSIVLKPKKRMRKTGAYDPRVELWKDGKHKSLLVSRLVAMTWCKGYRKELTVNHIDGNTLNNRSDNLEWITRVENIHKGYETGLYANCFKKCKLTCNGNEKEFKSLREASLYLGMNKGYFSNIVRAGKEQVTINGTRYTISF